MVRMAMSQNFLNRRLVVVEVEGRPGLYRVRYLIAVRIYQKEKMPGFNIFSLSRRDAIVCNRCTNSAWTLVLIS